jgi:hypothetical protein
MIYNTRRVNDSYLNEIEIHLLTPQIQFPSMMLTNWAFFRPQVTILEACDIFTIQMKGGGSRKYSSKCKDLRVSDNNSYVNKE